jgi:hypothetical protein
LEEQPSGRKPNGVAQFNRLYACLCEPPSNAPLIIQAADSF